MNLETIQSLWEETQRLKIENMASWEPEASLLNMDMTSPMHMIDSLNKGMSNHLDTQPIHVAEHDLALAAAKLSYEDFVIWNRYALSRAQQTGQLMAEISTNKIFGILSNQQ